MGNGVRGGGGGTVRLNFMFVISHLFANVTHCKCRFSILQLALMPHHSGLTHLNVSLDTLRRTKFENITRRKVDQLFFNSH